MIGLAVYLNGKKLTVAGADDLSVLNAIVNAVGELGKATAPIGKRRRKPDLWLTVGGLTRRSTGSENEHLNWIKHLRLKVGDRVAVKLVHIDRPDKHTSASIAGEARQRLAKLLKPGKSKSKQSARPKRARRRNER